MFNTVKKLARPFGVSGNESEVSQFIEDEIKEYCDEVKRDTLGNLIAVKYSGNGNLNEGETREKIMLAAHMDTIGVIATHVDEKGFIRFSNLGAVKPHCAIGQTVEFESGVRGIIYHEDSPKDMANIKISDLYIDTGLSQKEIAKKVSPGTCGKFLFLSYMQGDTIISGYLDDRAGCAVLIKTAERICQEIELGTFPPNKEVYYVFTVQEELGLRGAGPAAFNINPDWAVAVDVICAEDVPGAKDGTIFMGKGPVIKIKDNKVICHPLIRNKLKHVAQENEIPFQLGITERGGTDAGIIHKSKGGIITGDLSIATRYIHSPVEMCSLNDLKNAVLLLTELIRI